MISIASATDILKRPKTMAAMTWVRKLNRESGAWLEFVSAVHFEDDVLQSPEGLLVRGQWKPSVGVKPSIFVFGLHVGNDRIYAIDVKPSGLHKNSVGIGRALFRQTISGIHEHTWSSEGYGYAEPLELVGVAAAWKLFSEKASISGETFFHPDNGQMGLEL